MNTTLKVLFGVLIGITAQYVLGWGLRKVDEYAWGAITPEPESPKYRVWVKGVECKELKNVPGTGAWS